LNRAGTLRRNLDTATHSSTGSPSVGSYATMLARCSE